jgi:multiple sugar transport system substrate-binding protein
VPKGSERVEDAVEFMKFILSDQVQTNVYERLGNLPTRSDIEPAYDDPDVADTLQAYPVMQTPYTPVFFEMINSPQGPWLQMLQRVYYGDEPIEDIIADTKATMEEMSCEGAEAPATTG